MEFLEFSRFKPMNLFLFLKLMTGKSKKQKTFEWYSNRHFSMRFQNKANHLILWNKYIVNYSLKNKNKQKNKKKT